MNAISLATKGIISGTKISSTVSGGGGVIVREECNMPQIIINKIKIGKNINEQIKESLFIKILNIRSD